MKQKIIKGFKFIQDNMKSKNGNHIWKIGKWYKYEGKLKICEKGFHACLTPQQSLEYIYGDKWFIVEARGNIINDSNKFVASEMRLIKEILPEESTKILKKYKKPLDLTNLRKKLKDIPTKNDVIKLVKDIDKINWFKPQEPNKLKIQLKIDSILKAFNLDFKAELQLNPLNKKEDWDSARDSAWALARDSARDSAWALAWDLARDSAWDSAWALAWDSARDSARDSAWALAWDLAKASEFEVVKDLMKKKGYFKNPFKELLELWKMGLYPVGILKDKKFHVYYVPLRSKK